MGHLLVFLLSQAWAQDVAILAGPVAALALVARRAVRRAHARGWGEGRAHEQQQRRLQHERDDETEDGEGI